MVNIRKISVIIIFVAWFLTNTSITAQILSTAAGTGVQGHNGDNILATTAHLDNPIGVAVDSLGNLYIADQRNQRIRKVDVDGIITTVAGTGVQGYSGDGGPATDAMLNNPENVHVSLSGNLYIADTGNNRIRKVDSSGTITTIAGVGAQGFSGDGGLATEAQLRSPHDVFVDEIGNFYISDTRNHRIRKVDTFGVITTIAGNGEEGYNGDQQAAINASLNVPSGITIDDWGNLFIADMVNQRIRKVDVDGLITTIAGTGVAGASGENEPAVDSRIHFPRGVFWHSSSGLYIAENARVRKINSLGIIVTVAGNLWAEGGISGDGGVATEAKFEVPIMDVVLDVSGNLYLSDMHDHRIRKVSVAVGSPVITRIMPVSGPVGSNVVIDGSNFNITPSNNIVYFGAVKANVVSASSASLTVTVPSGATAGPISVQNAGLVAVSNAFFTPIFPGEVGVFKFAQRVDFSVNRARRPTIGDLDVDGKPDLIVVDDDGKVSIYANASNSGSINDNSFGTRLDFVLGTGDARSSKLGDLDGDGKLDLVVVLSSSNALAVFHNTSSVGNISFASPVTFSVPNFPPSVALVDLNLDGELDLAAPNGGSTQTISVFENITEGSGISSNSFGDDFEFNTVRNGQVAAADLNMDGKPDLVVAGESSSSLGILKNTDSLGVISAASLASQVLFGLVERPNSIALGDIDNDGNLDIITGNDGSLSVYGNVSNSSNISLSERRDFTTEGFTNGIDLGDLDGDGKLDLAVANQVANTVSVFRNNSVGSIGTNAFSIDTSMVAGQTTSGVAIGDLDADGLPDLAVSSTSNSVISIYRNINTSTVMANPMSEGNLTAAVEITEPVALSSVVDSLAEAVAVFDFTLTDAGGDGLALSVNQIVLHTSGDGPFAKVTWLLKEENASQSTTGSFDANKITFGGLNFSVADGESKRYVVEAYYNDNTGLIDNQSLRLSIDGDTDVSVDANGTQMGTTSPVDNGNGTLVQVIATKLIFATPPGDTSVVDTTNDEVVSGKVFSTQPVVVAQDGFGNVDLDFAEGVTIVKASGAGSLLSNMTVVASSGVADFSGSNMVYNAESDGEGFTLEANDASGGLDLSAASTSGLSADVIATMLNFTTQPSPLVAISGQQLDFTTDPVIVALDEQGIIDTDFSELITITANDEGNVSNNTALADQGQAFFSDLRLTYKATNIDETFALQANDQDDIGQNLSLISSNAISVTAAQEGRLTLVSEFNEPIAFPSTANSPEKAVKVFDFTLTDAGQDGFALRVDQIVINALGDGPFFKVKWQLDGEGLVGAIGSYNEGDNTIVFSSLPISISDGSSETYTIRAHYNENGGLVEGQIFELRIENALNLILGSGSLIDAVSPVTNSPKLRIDITATHLIFIQGPASAGTNTPANRVVSGQIFEVQPLVRALDDEKNLDVDFEENVRISLASGQGRIVGEDGVEKAARFGEANFSGLKYFASEDGESFTLEVQDLSGGIPSNATTGTLVADVVAKRLAFGRQPASQDGPDGEIISGQKFGIQPSIEARDNDEKVDKDFSGRVMITVSSGAGMLDGTTDRQAVSGIVDFSNDGLTYTAAADGELFQLEAKSIGDDISLMPAVSRELRADIINREPVIINQDSKISYVEGDQRVTFAKIEVSDPNIDDEVTVILALDNPRVGELTDDSGNGEVYNDVSGEWQVIGLVAEVNAALASVIFVPNEDNDLDATVNITVTDGGEDGVLPISEKIELNVMSINDPPVVESGDQTKYYKEGESVSLGSISITDPDAGEIITATLTLEHRERGRLTVSENSVYGETYDENTGVWRVTGAVEQVIEALESVTFVPVEHNDLNTSVKVEIVDGLEDGAMASIRTINLIVNGVNTSPSAINLMQKIPYQEDDPFVELEDIVVNDPDSGEIVTIRITLSNLDRGGELTTDSRNGEVYQNGTWRISDMLDRVNEALKSVKFIPPPNVGEEIVLEIWITDGEDGSDLRGEIRLIGTSVNDSPTLNPIDSPVSILEDAQEQEIHLSGLSTGSANESQHLTVVPKTDNISLFDVLEVDYRSPNDNGFLKYAPAPNAHGTATVTIDVRDNGGTKNGGIDRVSRSFKLEVLPVNDPPTILPIDTRTVKKNSGEQSIQLNGIGSGAPNEIQNLTLTAESDHKDLILQPNIIYEGSGTTGTLVFIPSHNQTGTATIRVLIQDDGGRGNGGIDSFTEQFQIIVDPGPSVFETSLGSIRELSWGTVARSETPDRIDFKVFNKGGATLNVSNLRINGTLLMKLITEPRFEVSAGGETVVVLELTPSVTGKIEATLTLTTDDPNNPSVSLDLTADVRSGKPKIFNLDDLSFDSAALGMPSTDDVTIQNKEGLADLKIFDVESDNPQVDITSFSTNPISVDGTSLIQASYTPRAFQARSGVIYVYSNAEENPKKIPWNATEVQVDTLSLTETTPANGKTNADANTIALDFSADVLNLRNRFAPVIVDLYPEPLNTDWQSDVLVIGSSVFYRNVQLEQGRSYRLSVLAATGSRGQQLGTAQVILFATGEDLVPTGTISGKTVLTSKSTFENDLGQKQTIVDTLNTQGGRVFAVDVLTMAVVSEQIIGEGGVFELGHLPVRSGAGDGSYFLYAEVEGREQVLNVGFGEGPGDNPDPLNFLSGESSRFINFKVEDEPLLAGVTPGRMLLSAHDFSDNQNDQLPAYVDSTGIVVVHLYAKELNELRTYEITLTYNSEQLAFLQFQAGDEPFFIGQNDSVVSIRLKQKLKTERENTITISSKLLDGRPENTVSGSGSLGVLKFMPMREALNQNSKITIDELILKSANRTESTPDDVSFNVLLQLREDFDGDGEVDFDDFIQFARNFNKMNISEPLLRFDLNGDRNIDVGDFMIFEQHYKKKLSDILR